MNYLKNKTGFSLAITFQIKFCEINAEHEAKHHMHENFRNKFRDFLLFK